MRAPRFLQRALFREECGATAIIVALIMVVLLGFAALVVDAGYLFEERRQLQNAVDSAALAGAQQIPIDVQHAKEQAYVYAERNGVARTEVVQNSIDFKKGEYKAMTVRAQRMVNLLFAPVLGTNFQNVDAQATAILCRIETSGIWPWGVTQNSIGPGQQPLKVGSRNSMTGNFMALDFPSSSGADDYREYIIHKYDGTGVPDPMPPNTWIVRTQTGDVAGPTLQGVGDVLGQTSTVPAPDIRNPRVGLVPILSADTWAQVRGSQEVVVVGFAAFYLEDMDMVPPGQAQIFGSFMRIAYGVGRSVDSCDSYEGLVGARLWE